MYTVKLEKFEGPLDLLLKLCQEEECSISEISLATIADQYCEEISKSTTIPLEELADFLVVAAQLLLIKSRLLLPDLFHDEEEPVPDLEQKLKVYRTYVEQISSLQKRLREHQYLFFRGGVPKGWERLLAEPLKFVPRTPFTRLMLHTIFKNTVSILEKVHTKLPTDAISRVVSLEEKIGALKTWLTERLTGRFSEVATPGQAKIDIILYFLAVLELTKQRYLSVEQEELWGEIIIRRDNTNGPSPANNTDNISAIRGASFVSPLV